MVKRPFFGLMRSRLRYQAVDGPMGEVKEIALPKRVVLLVKGCDMGGLKVGTSVKTGQRLLLSGGGYVISTVTGVISGLGEHTGYMNQAYGAVTIDVAGADDWDGSTLEAVKEPCFEVGRDYLGSIPGKSDFSSFFSLRPPMNTVVVSCVDRDLLILTNGVLLASDAGMLSEGIEYLMKVTKVGRVVVVVPTGFSIGIDLSGVEVMAVRPIYPNALPGMIAKDVLGVGYMPGRSFAEMGLGFMGAEAVLSLAGVFSGGVFPVDKVVTVIGKDGVPVVVRVRIGTPVGAVLDALGIGTSHGDRVVFGGPMCGEAVYSLDMPIMADTDAVMVQDGSRVMMSSDGQCINCGQCVRVCPVGVPVNMLVRFLSRSLYEEAADRYDLHCCIECGLCSYVCVARIPIFHHIMLGKQEFSRLKGLEGSNA